jgi:predicted transcriptional regulator
MASVHVTPDTRVRLDRLKAHPEESDDQLLNRLIDTYEEGYRLTREEVEEIREALRQIREGRFFTREQAREELPPGQEMPTPSVGDPQAVKDMEKILSGAAKKVDDTELTRTDTGDTDPGDIHEIEGFDTRGRSRTPHLDSL